MDRFSDCLFLTGPTASGKSDIGLAVAQILDAEIISLDSMTVYRGLDIGTAKPDREAQQVVRHHLIDVLDPWEPASLDWYLRQAELACEEIRNRRKTPLFVGGTPLYLKACLRGIFAGPAADPEFRNALEQRAAKEGTQLLHDELAIVDPVASQRIQPGDLRRIIRALEVFHFEGQPISRLQKQFDRPSENPPAVVCLTWPTDQLYDRINGRVLAMLKAGWIEEVVSLREKGVTLGKEASQAAGYKEIIEYLAGQLDHKAMVERIQTRTRQLSKRQRTWFRHIPECHFIHTCATEPSADRTAKVVEYFREWKLVHSQR